MKNLTYSGDENKTRNGGMKKSGIVRKVQRKVHTAKKKRHVAKLELKEMR